MKTADIWHVMSGRVFEKILKSKKRHKVCWYSFKRWASLLNIHQITHSYFRVRAKKSNIQKEKKRKQQIVYLSESEVLLNVYC